MFSLNLQASPRLLCIKPITNIPDRMSLPLIASISTSITTFFITVKVIVPSYTSIPLSPYRISYSLPHCTLVKYHLLGIENPTLGGFIEELPRGLIIIIIIIIIVVVVFSYAVA
ncbi:hypothetical protein KCU67_g11127, partial [Aureobasidium melanogenum]